MQARFARPAFLLLLIGVALPASAVFAAEINVCAQPTEAERSVLEKTSKRVSAVLDDATISNVSALLEQLQKLTEQTKEESKKADAGNPLCARPLVDKQVRTTLAQTPNQSSYETLLTVAASQAKAKIAAGRDASQVTPAFQSVVRILSMAGANLAATNDEGQCALSIAPELMPAQKDGDKSRCLSDQVMMVAKAEVGGDSSPDKKTYHFLEHITVNSATGPVVPDLLKSPNQVPPYVINLIRASQGFSFSRSEKNSNGSSPTVQGELRYGFDQDSTKTALVLAQLARIADPDNFESFAYLNANLNPRSQSGNSPPNPDWISTGLGMHWIFSRNQDLSDGDLAVTRWGTATVKMGVLQNRLYSENLDYRTVTLAGSYFMPASPRVEGSYPMYVGATVGNQLQFQNGSGMPTKSELKGAQYRVPSSYSFARLDWYGYPCGYWEQLCDLFHASKNSFTWHYDQDFINHDAGNLKELSLNFALTSTVTLSLGRSGGVPDPLQTFGVFPSPVKVWQNSVSLKLKDGKN